MRALALGLAAVIWVVAGSEKSRIASTPTFEVIRDARIVVKNVPQSMVVTEVPSSVTVRLRGTRGLETTAGDAEIIAVVNMAGVTPGQHLLAAEPLPPSGLEVVRSGPIMVGVTVEELVSAEFEVEAVIAASLAPEGMAGANTAPPVVRVEGPKEAVGSVSRVVALALSRVEEAPAEGGGQREDNRQIEGDNQVEGGDQVKGDNQGDNQIEEDNYGEREDRAEGQAPPAGLMAETQSGAVAVLLALDDNGEVVQGVEVYPGAVLVRW